MSDDCLNAMSEALSDLRIAYSDEVHEGNAGIICYAIQQYRNSHPRCNTTTTEKLRKYFGFLSECCYNEKMDNSQFLSRSNPKNSPMYHFFHNHRGAPTVEQIKKKIGVKNWFAEITATQLFENFDSPSEEFLVGTFTHCLYSLETYDLSKTIKKLGKDCYIIVAGIEEYNPEDGFQKAQENLSQKRLKCYSDQLIPTIKLDTSQINFVFPCRELPKMLTAQLKSSLILFEPSLSDDATIYLTTWLKIIERESWKTVLINADFLTVKTIRRIVIKQKSMTLKTVKQLQHDIRQYHQKWRVCWMYELPQWRFAMPCVVFMKKGGGVNWYLVFYAPLIWVNQRNVNIDDIENGSTVKSRLASIPYNNIDCINNANEYEQALNNDMDVSLLFHHTDCIDDSFIWAKHREACHRVAINLKYLSKKLIELAAQKTEPLRTAILCIEQIIDRDAKTKNTPSFKLLQDIQLLLPGVFKRMIDNVQLRGRDVPKVVFCNRNAFTSITTVENVNIVQLGPIKMVLFLKNDM